MIYFFLEDYIKNVTAMKLYSYISFQRPPQNKTKDQKKKKKKICYLQYIHKVQGGTSKYHAFKIVVQKIIIILFNSCF